MPPRARRTTTGEPNATSAVVDVTRSVVALPPDAGSEFEVFVNGVASLLRYADELQLANLRIFDNDVRHLLPALKTASFTRIFSTTPIRSSGAPASNDRRI